MEWVDQLGEDIDAAFAEASGRANGAIGRGPNRWYVEVHPQALRGFVDLVEHPWVRTVCEAVLGPQYHIVEVGFDIPFAGAKDQPWHRDFRSPRETAEERRLTSLAFNVTTVDTQPDMGPFEIALGTQFDDNPAFDHGMFPPKSFWHRYEERAVRKYPQRGDISARSALTIHRGTENHSALKRPVLVLGVDGPEADNSEHHDLAVTTDYWRRSRSACAAICAARSSTAGADRAEARHRGTRDGLTQPRIPAQSRATSVTAARSGATSRSAPVPTQMSCRA